MSDNSGRKLCVSKKEKGSPCIPSEEKKDLKWERESYHFSRKGASRRTAILLEKDGRLAHTAKRPIFTARIIVRCCSNPARLESCPREWRELALLLTGLPSIID